MQDNASHLRVHVSCACILLPALSVARTLGYGASGPQGPGDIRRLIPTWLATSVVGEVEW
jgi:hypothetical protein